MFAAEILELDVDDPEGLLTQPAKGRLTFTAMTVPGDDDDDKKKKKKKKAKGKKGDDGDGDGDGAAEPPGAELYTLSCAVEVGPHRDAEHYCID